MLEKVQAVAHDKGRNLSITSECTAEPYMDGIDGYLMVNPRSDKSIPLLSAVYSGYTIFFASWERSMKLSDAEFVSILGRDVLWGCKPGWFDLETLMKPENANKMSYFKSLGQVHYTGRKYFVYGEFLDQFESENKVEKTNYPEQMCTLWRAEDGSIALVLANFSDKTASFPVHLNLGDFVTPGNTFRRTFDLMNNMNAGIKIDDQSINEDMVLKPLEIKIIQII